MFEQETLRRFLEEHPTGTVMELIRNVPFLTEPHHLHHGEGGHFKLFNRGVGRQSLEDFQLWETDPEAPQLVVSFPDPPAALSIEDPLGGARYWIKQSDVPPA